MEELKINLSPIYNPEKGPVTLEKRGDVIIVDGEEYDLSPLDDGALLPSRALPDAVFAGPVERIDGELHLTIMLRHGDNAPEETTFPEPIIDPPDGVIELPPFGEVQEEEPNED